MNRLSDTFINVPSFTTKNGLNVSCSVESGINNMYAVISNVVINDQPRSQLFGNNHPDNVFIFYLYKFRTIGVYGPQYETDYSYITTNQTIPFNVKLSGADQGVIYNRMYFYHKEVIDGVVVTFERIIII